MVHRPSLAIMLQIIYLELMFQHQLLNTVILVIQLPLVGQHVVVQMATHGRIPLERYMVIEDIIWVQNSSKMEVMG